MCRLQRKKSVLELSFDVGLVIDFHSSDIDRNNN